MGLHRDGARNTFAVGAKAPATLGVMSDANQTPDSAADAARRLLEAQLNDRVEAVRELVSAANDADDAERMAQEARERHARAWENAIRSGWNEKELKQTGAKQPGGPAPKRRARRSNSAGGGEQQGSQQEVDLGITS